MSANTTSTVVSTKRLHLLNLPGEIIDEIVDQVLQTWDAYIRAGPLIPKEKFKQQMQEIYEAMLRGQNQSTDVAIPGTKYLHLHSIPTHGVALVLVCKKLRDHCTRWRKITFTRPSQAYFSGRAVFRDMQSFDLHQNVYYPRKLYPSWAVRFPGDLKEDRVAKMVAQRSAKWLRDACKIVEVRIDKEPGAYAVFERFKDYCPSTQALVLVYEIHGVLEENCCYGSEKWVPKQMMMLSSRCYAEGVKTITRALYYHKNSVQVGEALGVKFMSENRKTCIRSVVRSLGEEKRIKLDSSIRTTFESVDDVSNDGHECYYGMPSWQLAQIRRMEEQSSLDVSDSVDEVRR